MPESTRRSPAAQSTSTASTRRSPRTPPRNKEVGEIYDLFALRVLVNEIQDCYAALGVVHGRWHPIPGQFDDYIANPKDNLYQSLHTTVLCQDAFPVEVQVRTHEMPPARRVRCRGTLALQAGGRSGRPFSMLR